MTPQLQSDFKTVLLKAFNNQDIHNFLFDNCDYTNSVADLCFKKWGKLKSLENSDFFDINNHIQVDHSCLFSPLASPEITMKVLLRPAGSYKGGGNLYHYYNFLYDVLKFFMHTKQFYRSTPFKFL